MEEVPEYSKPLTALSALREWFGEVDEVVSQQCQMERLRTDPCVWIKKDSQTVKTIGYFASRVDDFLVSGQWNHPEWVQACGNLQEGLRMEPVGRTIMCSLFAAFR